MSDQPDPGVPAGGGSESPPSTSWKRVVPAPWIDCPACGWRHYPDSGRRRGPRMPEACASCGSPLPQPEPPA